MFVLVFCCFVLFFILLFSSLLKHFIAFENLILLVLTLKKTPLCGFCSTKNACVIKEFRPLSLQLVELHYILLVIYTEWETVVYVLYI